MASAARSRAGRAARVAATARELGLDQGVRGFRRDSTGQGRNTVHWPVRCPCFVLRCSMQITTSPIRNRSCALTLGRPKLTNALRIATPLGLTAAEPDAAPGLCAPSGSRLGEAAAGPANIRLGLDVSFAAVLEATQACLAQAGLRPAICPGSPPASPSQGRASRPTWRRRSDASSPSVAPRSHRTRMPPAWARMAAGMGAWWWSGPARSAGRSTKTANIAWAAGG